MKLVEFKAFDYEICADGRKPLTNSDYKQYVNPEFVSLVNNRRLESRLTFICMTNGNTFLVEQPLGEVVKMLENK